VQEVAFTLAKRDRLCTSGSDAGLAVDEFAPRLSFFFNAHNNFLEQIAKFRAARRLWARVMRERFGAKDARSLMLRFHAQTAGSALTAQQPENNIVRVLCRHWPRCWEDASRSMPTVWMKLLLCQQKTRRCLHCERSRSSRTKAVWRIPLIPSAARSRLRN